MKKPTAKAIRKKQRIDRYHRRRSLAISADKAWESLRSHLADAVKCKKIKGDPANEEWHARCCLDYAAIIYSTTRELHELAKLDFRAHVTSLAAKL